MLDKNNRHAILILGGEQKMKNVRELKDYNNASIGALIANILAVALAFGLVFIVLFLHNNKILF